MLLLCAVIADQYLLWLSTSHNPTLKILEYPFMDKKTHNLKKNINNVSTKCKLRNS